MDRLATTLKLKEVTETILSRKSSFGQLRQAVHDLYEILSTIPELHTGDEDSSVKPCQNSFSPADAAYSTLDLARTTQFIRGVFSAVEELTARFPGETLSIAYAGCGPLATLALPLTLFYTPQQVQFYLIDIHCLSIDHVRQVFNMLGLEDYVQGYIVGDASNCSYIPEEALHLILSETMQKALLREPQVAVVSHLINKLKEGGLVVPENVSLKASLMHPRSIMQFTGLRDHQIENIELGTVFELNEHTARAMETKLSIATDVPVSEPVKVNIPPHNSEDYKLKIRTHITVFGDVVLKDFDCSLTLPTSVRKVTDIGSGAEVEFSYYAGEKPELRCRQLS